MADRRRDLSLYLFNRLQRQGESPYRMFSLLLRQFRLISRVKALAADHDYPEIASRGRDNPPFLVTKVHLSGAEIFAERLRISIFLELKKAQVELHSSRYMDEGDYQGWILERLIVERNRMTGSTSWN